MPAQTNQQINTIVPRDKVLCYWAYFMAKGLRSLLQGMGGGATMVNVNKSKFSSIEVTIPSASILSHFNETAVPIFDQIERLSLANQNLTKARDLLLPRLMNGEIPV